MKHVLSYLLYLALIGNLAIIGCKSEQSPVQPKDCDTFQRTRSACASCPKPGLAAVTESYSDQTKEGATDYLMEVDPKDELKNIAYDRRPLSVNQLIDALPADFSIRFKASIDPGRYGELYIYQQQASGNEKLTLLFYSKAAVDPEMQRVEGLYILKRDNNIRLDKSLQSYPVLQHIPASLKSDQFTEVGIEKKGQQLEVEINGDLMYTGPIPTKGILFQPTFVTNGRFEIKDLYYCAL